MKKVFRVIDDFQVLYLNQFQRSLVHVYRAAQFCGTTLDLDHHSVQLAWSVKSPGYILDLLFKRARIFHLLSFGGKKLIKPETSESEKMETDLDNSVLSSIIVKNPKKNKDEIDEDKSTAMMEAAFTVILTILGSVPKRYEF